MSTAKDAHKNAALYLLLIVIFISVSAKSVDRSAGASIRKSIADDLLD